MGTLNRDENLDLISKKLLTYASHNSTLAYLKILKKTREIYLWQISHKYKMFQKEFCNAIPRESPSHDNRCTMVRAEYGP
jgi:hypothetical protein